MRKVFKRFGELFAPSQESIALRVRIGLDSAFGELEIAMIAANVRAGRFDGMGRLTHTQEILRAQAQQMSKTYRGVLDPEFKARVVEKIVKEILR